MILPFKGLIYNQETISSLADVITPPYDVISQDLQDDLLNRSVYNFCHIDLPKPTDSLRYEQAQSVFEEWLKNHVVLKDQKPAFYLHRHSFYLPHGERVSRIGFFSACLVEDFSTGKILPHEKTLDLPKLDRLNITRATQTNLSAVFSLYDDKNNTVPTLCQKLLISTPFMDFVTDDNERHEMWKVQDPQIINQISELLSDKPYFIADGHHRYETAINYCREILTDHPDLPDSSSPRYTMMYFCNLSDPGLVILPIHRCLKDLQNFNLSSVLDKIQEHFEIQKFPKDDLMSALNIQNQMSEDHHAFLMLTHQSSDIYLLSIEHEKWKTLAQARSIHPALAELDVTVLHNEIFQNQFHISEEDLAKQTYLIYEKSTESALFHLYNESAQVVFLMNPTKINQMQNVAQAQLKMPQKSTFFYPKVPSGLVMHSVSIHEQDGLDS